MKIDTDTFSLSANGTSSAPHNTDDRVEEFKLTCST